MQPLARMLACALLAVLAGAVIFAFLQPETTDRIPTAGTLLDPPRPINDFALIDHDEQPFANEGFTGRWSLVFFGFTQCEGVCPMTMAKLSETVAQVERPLTVIFVSVDTRRDTPEIIARYVRSFGDDFIGLTGEPREIDKLAGSLLAPYSISGEGVNVTVDHSSTVFLVDPDGKFAGLFSAPLDVQALANDLRKII